MTTQTIPDMNKHILQLRSFPVLDKGFIRLVDWMGSDRAIDNAARLSYASNRGRERSDAEVQKLLNYLMRNGHMSPFEMCEVVVHIKMPIFVARQWVRHRTASLNEISARYSELPSDFFVPELTRMAAQSKTNKQGSGEALPVSVSEQIHEDMVRHGDESFRLYNGLLADGLTRELSRAVLPVSTYTEWVWKCDLRNILGFLKLRMDHHAQAEIREYAHRLGYIVKTLFPMAYSAWETHDWCTVRLGRGDLESRGADAVTAGIPAPVDYSDLETMP